MLLDKGVHGRERILSRHSGETLTTDHLTGARKAASTFAGDVLENFGWGFGVAVVTRRSSRRARGAIRAATADSGRRFAPMRART
jgi:hypothetical protein